MIYTAYTDGAYSSAKDSGGIGICIIKQESENSEIQEVTRISKQFKSTTNSRMEVKAIINALKCIESYIDEYIIISDSMYALCCSGLFEKVWKRKLNLDLWSEFDSVYNEKKKLIGKITLKWVKGHNGDKYNEIADSLAQNASNLINL